MGVQSLEMLKARASLEEKLKEKGLYSYSHTAPKPRNSLKRLRPANGCQLETYDDRGDYYKQVEKLRAAKLAAKAETYSRKSAAPSLPEETLEGKRHITSQMEKNRGLTRRRNKDKKNPRKNYKSKYQRAVKKVQSIKKPTGPYGGESSGINATISRSTKFKR